MRRIDGCMNCGETREIAAYGLCFKCYRQSERANEKPDSTVDRHNPGLRREHKKLLRAFTTVMAGLGDLGASTTDITAIRQIIDPYLASIAKFLVTAAPSSPIEEQLSEHVNEIQESVHSSLEPEHELARTNPEPEEMTVTDPDEKPKALEEIMVPSPGKRTLGMIAIEQRRKHGALHDLVQTLSRETLFDKDGNPVSFQVKRHVITVWSGRDIDHGRQEGGK